MVNTSKVKNKEAYPSTDTPSFWGNWKLEAKQDLYTYQERRVLWDFNKPLHSG